MTNLFEDYRMDMDKLLKIHEHELKQKYDVEIDTLKQIIESQKQEIAKLKGSKNE